MADILIASWDGGGNVPTCLAVIRRLKARGHRVRVLGDDATRAEIETVGGAFRPWRAAYNRPDRRPETDHIHDWEATEPGGDLQLVLDRIMIGPAARYAQDTAEEIWAHRPDLLIGSDLMFGPTIAAEASRIPQAMLCSNISLFPIDGMPPLGPGLPPPRNEEEQAQARQAADWFKACLAQRLPVLNAARAELGLTPLAHPLDQLRKVDAMLLATSREFDFPPPIMPQRFSYVGPLLDPPEWARSWVSPWQKDDPRPLVLLALSSTFQNQAPDIQKVLDAVAEMPLRLVATRGPALAGHPFAVPDNGHVLDGASHDAIMAEAAAVITHCGHGTVMRALSHGRPLLCLPMGRDQNDNAVRVTSRGAGLRLDRGCSAEDLRNALHSLLTIPAFTEAAARLGKAIAQAEAPNALVTALEALLPVPTCLKHA